MPLLEKLLVIMFPLRIIIGIIYCQFHSQPRIFIEEVRSLARPRHSGVIFSQVWPGMFLCLILQSNEPWVCHLAFFLWTSGNYLNLINSDGDLKGILNKKSNIFKNQLVIKDFGINFTSRLKWDWCSCEMGWIRYCLIWMGPIQYSTYTEMEISR